MTAQQLAALLTQMADLLECQGENLFRIRAYRRGAQAVEAYGRDLEQLANAGQLRTIPGIGEDLAAKITEAYRTGTIAALDRLKQQMPSGILELLRVPGLGPKTAMLLHTQLKVDTLEALEQAIAAGRLTGVPGFQKKKTQNLLKGIQTARQGSERMLLGDAYRLAEDLLALLGKVPGVRRVSMAGSLRRMRETIGDLDLLAASEAPARVMAALTRSAFCAQVLGSGDTKTSIVTPQGVQVDLRVVPPKSFGAALQYFTGSKEHNVRLREFAARKGLKVNEYGVFRVTTNRWIAGREEADVYKALGLRWMPPEMREDAGELDAALAGRLPRLVEAKDIRGDFHIHTDATDGRHPLDAVANAAEARGYEYIAVCDHSRSLRIARGLGIDQLRAHVKKIRALSATMRTIRLLAGTEMDILPDGSLDYPDTVLRELDFVVASIHSAFAQSQTQLTRRLVRAMENPYVTLIAHPTGRRIGLREPYPLEMDEVFRAAKRTGTALEINAQPERLDLRDHLARQAQEAGVMLAISTDTHTLRDFDHMAFGLGIARRAWIRPRQVLNTMTRAQLTGWIAAQRARKGGR